MSLVFLYIENKKNKAIEELCADYLKRIQLTTKVAYVSIPSSKVADPLQQKEMESAAILNYLKPLDTLIICDEQGKSFTSIAFSTWLQNLQSKQRGRIVFAIGGAYGFTAEVKNTYTSIRLSDFVFPHQLAKLLLMEQVYRAISIAKNLPYHHS